MLAIVEVGLLAAVLLQVYSLLSAKKPVPARCKK
jgi:hypothetical protein